MHDTIAINIPITEQFIRYLGNDMFTIIGDLSYYNIRIVGDVRRDPENDKIMYSEIKNPYESIASSYAGMVSKFYHLTKNAPPYLSLKASPKILQGHNVYYTDNIQTQIFEMLGMFKDYYPDFFALLDIKKAHISRIDATYSCRLPSQNMVDKTNKFIGNIQVGQRKPNKKRGKEKGYHTNYWGSENSRIGECKSYGKHQDVEREIASYKRKADRGNTYAVKMLEIFNDDLLNFASGLIRFESTTRKEKLNQLDIPSNVWEFILYQRKHPDVLQTLWHYWFDPIFSAFNGDIMQDIDDNKIYDLCMQKLVTTTASGNISYTRAKNAINFYDLLKQKGWEEIRERIPKSTFNKNVKALCEIGLPRSMLQNMTEQEGESIPLVELIKMDFSNQCPVDYCPPTSKYAKDFQAYLKPKLKLVS